MKKGKLLLIVGITTVFMLKANDNARAQDGPLLASNHPAMTKNPSGTKTKTNAPKAHLVKHKLDSAVVQEFEGDGKAMFCSLDGNIAIHIYHGKKDSISGERYAKGLAKGFAHPEVTEGKPINITSTYDIHEMENQSVVVIYINGERWKYKHTDGETYEAFPPQFVRDKIPEIMQDYVDEYGCTNIIQEKQAPSITAALD